jgi:AP-1 complex subunit beta-1
LLLTFVQSIVLSQKPAISTTMTSLPATLLEQLLSELSTLASVYHKPPESFVGKGRFGADEIQRAAIQEQRQNAAENPIVAAVAAQNGTAPTAAQGNIENLLDIDFDGAAPASQEAQNSAGATPDRVASPTGQQSGGSMADMMGLFDAPPPAVSPGASNASPGGANDLMNGFGALDLGGSSQPPPASMQLGGVSSGGVSPGGQQQQQQQQQKAANDDLLGLF